MTPIKRTVATEGANAEATLFMASKILENLSPCVDQTAAITITTKAEIRPQFTNFFSLIVGFILLTISIETSVEILFNAAAIVLINAASKAEKKIP